jgi:hypothetical protein
MQRRTALLIPSLWSILGARSQARPVSEPIERVAMAWRRGSHTGGDAATGHQVGVLHIDWAAAQVQVQTQVDVPSRAHGLLRLADAGFLTVANRPGRWLLRCDAQGQPMVLKSLTEETPQRTLNGHAEASRDGQWVFTTETDPATGLGWLSVRDVRTLERVRQFESHGIDPHQLLLATDGTLMVANGGIPRDPLGRKIADMAMAPNLARIDPRSGLLLGGWRLPDARLSIRHLAWAHGPRQLLGLALQAEHAATSERAEAPTLAVWDGRDLHLPSADPRGAGYAGDIAAAAGGGFVISAQKQGRCLWWHPSAPEVMTLVAELTEPCALLASRDGLGVTLGAGRGLARWHTQLQPRMVRWPVLMAPDNHAVWLAGEG